MVSYWSWKHTIASSLSPEDYSPESFSESRGVYFSTIRVQSVWKTNNEIVEGKYSMSKIYLVFEYFYETKLIILIPSTK